MTLQRGTRHFAFVAERGGSSTTEDEGDIAVDDLVLINGECGVLLQATTFIFRYYTIRLLDGFPFIVENPDPVPDGTVEPTLGPSTTSIHPVTAGRDDVSIF